MGRVYNFAAGPSTLPLEVLQKAQEQMQDYNGTGMSVLEMSHRSKAYLGIIEQAEADLREIMNIPKNYDVLFLQGGASMQFSMVPINLMVKSMKADYINTGVWSKSAIQEAKKVGKVNVVASSQDQNFTYFPIIDADVLNKDADYVHITSNNTIYGTKCNVFPTTGDIPLVADMSSNIMSEKINVSDFGLIYAGAQKNIGPAGVTAVIIRKDLTGKAPEDTPTMLKYSTHTEKGSMYNTPPAYSIYIMGLVLQWVKSIGGIAELEKRNKEKAALLYDALDNSKLFTAPVRKDSRSLMNVVFVTGNPDLDKKFVTEAKANNLISLEGHRNVGGIRASLYNAMTIDGVEALVKFIEKFDAQNA